MNVAKGLPAIVEIEITFLTDFVLKVISISTRHFIIIMFLFIFL